MFLHSQNFNQNSASKALQWIKPQEFKLFTVILSVFSKLTPKKKFLLKIMSFWKKIYGLIKSVFRTLSSNLTSNKVTMKFYFVEFEDISSTKNWLIKYTYLYLISCLCNYSHQETQSRVSDIYLWK